MNRKSLNFARIAWRKILLTTVLTTVGSASNALNGCADPVATPTPMETLSPWLTPTDFPYTTETLFPATPTPALAPTPTPTPTVSPSDSPGPWTPTPEQSPIPETPSPSPTESPVCPDVDKDGLTDRECGGGDCNDQDDQIGGPTLHYPDQDADGYGDLNASETSSPSTVMICGPSSGEILYVEDNTDCDDQNASVHPDGEEVCNGIDDDCDGLIDEAVMTTYYVDLDSDNYGDVNTFTMACLPPQGYAALSGDCDDQDENVNPEAEEVCNQIDDNCDGQVDEAVQTTWYQDADGDGYGDDTLSVEDCIPPVGYVDSNSDCSDSDNTIHPGATEICDAIDHDCDTKFSPCIAMFTGLEDIFLAGQGISPSTGMGVLPILIPLTPGTNRIIQISNASGISRPNKTVTTCNISPDGTPNTPADVTPCTNYIWTTTDINSYGSLSGIVHSNRAMFLAGVFPNASPPNGQTPSRLNYADPASPGQLSSTATDYSPLLNQTFFVGDGLTETGTGTLQRFHVPDGATSFYLGFEDANSFHGAAGYYDDNSSTVVVTVNLTTGQP